MQYIIKGVCIYVATMSAVLGFMYFIGRLTEFGEMLFMLALIIALYVGGVVVDVLDRRRAAKG